MDGSILIKARLHNLKNVTLAIPKNRLVVLTGLSGSGKSTLAFDTLHKEGQGQYLKSLGMVTGYVSKPAVDSITDLSPSISVDQHLTNRSPRSTVGTATEVLAWDDGPTGGEPDDVSEARQTVPASTFPAWRRPDNCSANDAGMHSG